MSIKKTISVIGFGYVGLTTAVGFGVKGHKIIAIDISPERVKSLNQRQCYIYEEGIPEALENIDIVATTDYTEIASSDITFICVGTPSNADGSMHTEQLSASIKQLAETLKKINKQHLVVVRCTMVPGTTDKIIKPLLANTGLCVNPEFLREGKAFDDFLFPSRIIIGEDSKESGDMLQALYADFHCPILRTDFKTAEMIKYASNSFLASKISLINEIGNICKLLGIDVYQVARGMGLDQRIGDKFLNAGIGFGGSCFPKDLKGLIHGAKEMGYQPHILEEVLDLNEEQPFRLIQLLEKHLEIKGKTIGILGLSFKPETDDIRESPAIPVIKSLIGKGARVRVYDPQAMPNFKELYPQLEYTLAPAVLDSDAILLLTEWHEFETLDYKGKIVIDGRNIKKAREARIYEGICW